MLRNTIVITTVLGACLLGVRGNAYAQDAEGSGTLTVVDTTYEFHVTWCDLGATQSPDGPTLSGTGTTEAGVGFTVTVDRTTVGNTTSHGVSVYMDDGSESLSYSGTKMGAGWMTSSGIVPDPPIQIEGPHVRATGGFENLNGEMVGEGTLEAECR